MFCREGQKRDIPGSLDGLRQCTLVRGASSRQSPGQDLTAFGNKLPDQPHVFVIDEVNFFGAKPADLAATKVLLAWASRAAFAPRRSFSISSSSSRCSHNGSLPHP
jgi:hypothetical protein